MPKVLDLPKHIVDGSLDGLRRADAKPPVRSFDPLRDELDEPRPPPSRDGGSDSLLQLMRREVDDEMRAADAGTSEEAGAAPVVAAPTPPPIARGPVGDLKPAGGY